MTLETFFKENPFVALGFSGGVDSSYLLSAGLRYGANIRAYFVKTAFQPEFELRDAYRIAEQLNTEITVIRKDVLTEPEVAGNPENRCYYCKKAIFGVLMQRASRDGYPILADGTNASDDYNDRPGMRALLEMAVRSPLRECGLTKDDVRRLSKEAGLFTWNKPSYSCLATRIPMGMPITADLLNRVEAAEDALFSMGFSDFRVRIFENAARLQVPPEQLPGVIEKRSLILETIQPYFSVVLVDLAGR